MNDFQMIMFFGLGSGDSHFKQWIKVKIHPTPEKGNSIEHDYICFLGRLLKIVLEKIYLFLS